MAPYRVTLSRRAVKAVESGRVPLHIVNALLQLMQGDLTTHPRRVGKPLHEPFFGQWSVRIGPDYRATYIINDASQEIQISAIGPRSDIYRG